LTVSVTAKLRGNVAQTMKAGVEAQQPHGKRWQRELHQIKPETTMKQHVETTSANKPHGEHHREESALVRSTGRINCAMRKY
jgi:hypothetical protein